MYTIGTYFSASQFEEGLNEKIRQGYTLHSWRDSERRYTVVYLDPAKTPEPIANQAKVVPIRPEEPSVTKHSEPHDWNAHSVFAS